MVLHGGRVITSHVRHGNDALISLDLEAQKLGSDGKYYRERQKLTLHHQDAYLAAKAILAECGRAVRLIDPDALAERIEDNLSRGAIDAHHKDHAVSCMRSASNVMHRVADLIQAGTLKRAIVAWDATAERTTVVELSTYNRDISGTFEMGRGSVNTSITERQER